MGILWEHYVLNELHAHFERATWRYWRSKHGAEIDFVWAPRNQAPVAIECKWSVDHFDPGGVKAFRARYPSGPNLVVAHDVGRAFTKHYGQVPVRFVSLDGLVQALAQLHVEKPRADRHV